MTNAKPYNAADYLDSPEMIATYLTGALESEDPALIARAIDAVARAEHERRRLESPFAT